MIDERALDNDSKMTVKAEKRRYYWIHMGIVRHKCS